MTSHRHVTGTIADTAARYPGRDGQATWRSLTLMWSVGVALFELWSAFDHYRGLSVDKILTEAPD